MGSIRAVSRAVQQKIRLSEKFTVGGGDGLFVDSSIDARDVLIGWRLRSHFDDEGFDKDTYETYHRYQRV
jgi:hypothetical protein